MTPRTLFFGTPDFAVPSLDALAELADAGILELCAVVTQPDRRGDRGRVTSPAVKERATMLGLPVLQPERLRGEPLRLVLGLAPELLVWAAYGNLIPAALIGAASGRAANVHASLLPRWRGAAPVAHAILAGDEETGVTLMEGTAALDEGPVLAQQRTRIGPLETAGALTDRLARMGAALLRKELPRYLAGALAPAAQDPSGATWAPKLSSADARVDWSRPAEQVARLIRAMAPAPGAWTSFRGQRIGITLATVTGGRGVDHGTFEVWDGLPHVAAGAGWLRLDSVRPAGKREMSGAEWARGLRLAGAERLPSGS